MSDRELPSVVQSQYEPMTATTYGTVNDLNDIEVIDQPDTYLPCSILVMLCCCPLFGFVALIYSFQVDADMKTGRFKEAKSASHVARKLNMCGLIFGIIQHACVIFVVVLVMIILATVAEAFRN